MIIALKYRNFTNAPRFWYISALVLILVFLSLKTVKAQCLPGSNSNLVLYPVINSGFIPVSLSTGTYATVFVVKGFSYLFYTHCAAFNTQLTLFDSGFLVKASNSQAVCLNGIQAVISYTALYSGKIYLQLGDNTCSPTSNNALFDVSVTNVNNTQDDPTASGTGSSWIAHMFYEPIATVVNYGHYAGDFTEPGHGLTGLDFDEVFGDGTQNFTWPLFSNGVHAVSEKTIFFSVKFRNNNTLDGIYQVTLGADDGIGLSIKTPADLASPQAPVLVSSFSPPGLDLYNYHPYIVQTSTLFSLNGLNNGSGTGANNFEISYFQRQYADRATFKITGAENTISTLSTIVINNSNAVITASDFQSFYADASYQWQVSNSPTAAFTNVVAAGASQNYIPDIINQTSVNEVFYFRRRVSTGGVTHFSNYVTWTVTPALEFTTVVKSIKCTGSGTGSIEALANPGTGTAPYHYSLNGNPYVMNGDFIALAPGSYTVTVLDAAGSTSSKVVVLTAPDSLHLIIKSPSPVVSPLTIDLTSAGITNGSTAGLSYSYFSDSLATLRVSDPGSISIPGIYYIKGLSDSGCFVIKPVMVSITREQVLVAVFNLSVPTLFTPNGDGVNDTFVIRGLDKYPDNELSVFNRWGNEVYHAKGYMIGSTAWNGSGLSMGTYFYLLTVHAGRSSRRLSGYVMLIP